MDLIQQLLQVLGQQPTYGGTYQGLQQGVQSPISPMQFNDNNNQALQGYYNRENAYYPPQQAQSYPAFQYNPAIANAPTPLPQAQMPTFLAGVDPQIAKDYFNLLAQTLPVTRAYGIPDAVTAAQMAQESGYTKKPAAKNNFFGLKAHSYPGFAHFDTPQQGAEYYAQTVKSLVPNLAQLKNDPMAVLKALQSHGKSGNYEGDNPNPMQYVYDVSNNPAWSAYGQSPMTVNPRGWK